MIATGICRWVLPAIAALLLASCSFESSPMLKGMVQAQNEAKKIATPEDGRTCIREVRNVYPPEIKQLGDFKLSASAASLLSQLDWNIWTDDLVLLIAPVEVRSSFGTTSKAWIGCTFKVANGRMTFVKAYEPGNFSRIAPPT